MKTTAQKRAAALADMHEKYKALLTSAERLHRVLMAEVGLSTISPSILSIMHLVAEHFDLPITILTAHTRANEHCQARHIAMYLCMQLTNFGSIRIGDAFDHDYSSVLYAKKTMLDRMSVEPELAATIDLLKTRASQALQAA